MRTLGVCRNLRIFFVPQRFRFSWNHVLQNCFEEIAGSCCGPKIGQAVSWVKELLEGSSQDLDTWLGWAPAFMSHEPFGRGPTTLLSGRKRSPWYKSWDDPPSMSAKFMFIFQFIRKLFSTSQIEIFGFRHDKKEEKERISIIPPKWSPPEYTKTSTNHTDYYYPPGN